MYVHFDLVFLLQVVRNTSAVDCRNHSDVAEYAQNQMVAHFLQVTSDFTELDIDTISKSIELLRHIDFTDDYVKEVNVTTVYRSGTQAWVCQHISPAYLPYICNERTQLA